jgi:hypothetical protein
MLMLGYPATCSWGLTDEEPFSELGEKITLGADESVYSQTFTATVR